MYSSWFRENRGVVRETDLGDGCLVLLHPRPSPKPSEQDLLGADGLQPEATFSHSDVLRGGLRNEEEPVLAQVDGKREAVT
jgi:hypothetical protein